MFTTTATGANERAAKTAALVIVCVGLLLLGLGFVPRSRPEVPVAQAAPVATARPTSAPIIIFATTAPGQRPESPQNPPPTTPAGFLAAAPPTIAVPTPEPQPTHVDAPVVAAPVVQAVAGGEVSAAPAEAPVGLQLPPDAVLVQNPGESYYQVDGSDLRYHVDDTGQVAEVTLPGSETYLEQIPPTAEPQFREVQPTATPYNAPCPGRARVGRCG
jgi:hypothetical protein